MKETVRAIQREVVGCRACPRLVEWRERVGREKRRAFAGEDYWARPVPAFGDPEARMLVVGLAPAAHGANRTGRMFTGDRSGDWLYAALHRAGFANQPSSVAADDGLELTDALVTAANRCAPPANRPTPAERDRCAPYLLREIRALSRLRVIVALGGFAWDQVLRILREEPGFTVASQRPRFGHGAEVEVATGIALIGCYHPSQQNTFTGRLTPEMLDDVFRAARQRL
jgi:uracil-DNA glycosylase